MKSHPPACVGPPDPKTGQPVAGADRRAEFERLTRRTPRDRKAELAFIEGKIELIRTDPQLSEAEKKRAIADLKRGRGASPAARRLAPHART